MDAIGSIWNRVLLLISGFVVGWNLCNYWTVAPDDVPRQRSRILTGAGVGLVMLVWIGLDSPAAAAYGLGVVAFTALVAYAGSAREASVTPELWPRPRPVRQGGVRADTLVVLVSQGEPEHYEGPAPWAWHLAWLAEAGVRVPSWFSRPRVYAQIRKVVSSSAPEFSMAAWMTSLQEALSYRLGDSLTCVLSYTFVKPGLASTLAHLAEEGYTRFVVVSIGPVDEESVTLALKLSRVREVGVQVALVQPVQPLCWDKDYAITRLTLMLQGEPALVPDERPESCAETLQSAITAEMKRQGWLCQATLAETVASG